MPCFGSHFENGRHLKNFENAELQNNNNNNNKKRSKNNKSPKLWDA